VVLGSGNIGTDLLIKLLGSPVLQPTAMVGIDPASDGLARARALGLETSTAGAAWIAERPGRWRIAFDATSARAHLAHVGLLVGAGLRVIDLTPAKAGPGVVPTVNLDAHLDAPDLSLISCGGQAAVPIVAAVARATTVPYAELVSTIASRSAGPGTRQNIDEFTRTTAAGLTEVGGARRGKAIIILNPAEPPILMRNTVFCAIPEGSDRAAIVASVREMCARVAEYVPGYRLRTAPVFDADRVSVFVEVEGAGDYLPRYAGNLDIMTAAAVRVGEELARRPAHA
jgi:acetaldehyde dehydrogenase